MKLPEDLSPSVILDFPKGFANCNAEISRQPGDRSKIDIIRKRLERINNYLTCEPSTEKQKEVLKVIHNLLMDEKVYREKELSNYLGTIDITTDNTETDSRAYEKMREKIIKARQDYDVRLLGLLKNGELIKNAADKVNKSISTVNKRLEFYRKLSGKADADAKDLYQFLEYYKCLEV